MLLSCQCNARSIISTLTTFSTNYLTQLHENEMSVITSNVALGQVQDSTGFSMLHKASVKQDIVLSLSLYRGIIKRRSENSLSKERVGKSSFEHVVAIMHFYLLLGKYTFIFFSLLRMLSSMRGSSRLQAAKPT